jgi:hypothetical protein
MNPTISQNPGTAAITLVANREHYISQCPPEHFAIELADLRNSCGQVVLDMAPQSGHVDDILSVCVEAAYLPGTSTATQAVRIRTGDDSAKTVLSIFKTGESLVLKTCQGHSVRTSSEPNDGSTLEIFARDAIPYTRHCASVEGFDDEFYFLAPINAPQHVVQGHLIDAMAQRLHISIREVDAQC